MIYLACPHSHEDENVRKLRRIVATKVADWLMVTTGITVFSPLTYSHTLYQYAEHCPIEQHEFWMKLDLEILGKCNEIVVIPLPGYATSEGVKQELNTAIRLKLRRKYFTNDYFPNANMVLEAIVQGVEHELAGYNEETAYV